MNILKKTKKVLEKDIFGDLVVEENAHLDLTSTSGNLNLYLNENSSVNFYILQNRNTEFICNAHLEKNSRINYVFGLFDSNNFQINTYLNGEGSESRKYGLFLGTKDQKFDITTNVTHVKKNTSSKILVKGVLFDNSVSKYKGKIKINEKAQNTDSYLSNHNLLLSKGAEAFSIPSLEIDANDVRASHGATLGKPNEDEIFYLMARGLKRKEAERLIIKGYFSPVIDKLGVDDLKIKFNQALTAKIR